MKKYWLIKEFYVNVGPKNSEQADVPAMFVAKLTEEEVEKQYDESVYYQHGEKTDTLQGSEDSYVASAVTYEVREITREQYKIAKAVIKAYDSLDVLFE